MKESPLWNKEDIKNILKKLGIKEGDKPSPVCFLNQNFVHIPEVGEVICPLKLDDVVKEASSKILSKNERREEALFLNYISWYESMIVAEKLGLKLLTSQEYWQCLRWALDNKNELAQGLKAITWTNTIMVPDFSLQKYGSLKEKALKHLLKSHNYKGKLPILIQEPKIIQDESFVDGYKLEGGKLIVPKKLIDDNHRWFSFGDLDKETGLPFTGSMQKSEDRPYRYISPLYRINYLSPISCGFNILIEQSYYLYTNHSLSTSEFNIGIICKKK